MLRSFESVLGCYTTGGDFESEDFTEWDASASSNFPYLNLASFFSNMDFDVPASSNEGWNKFAIVSVAAVLGIAGGIAYERLMRVEESSFSPLQTDFYEIIMNTLHVLGDEFKSTITGRSTSYLHFREPVVDGCSYTVVAGLVDIIDWVNHFQFSDKDLAYLAALKDSKGEPRFSYEFLEELRNMKLNLNISAVPEGTVMTGAGPVMRMEGPAGLVKFIEPIFLNLIAASSVSATKASFAKHSMPSNCVFLNFSFRRNVTGAGGIFSERGTVIGGIDKLANPYASRKLAEQLCKDLGRDESDYAFALKELPSIDVVGTMAHNHIQSYEREGVPRRDTERECFETFLRVMPNNAILLVDTYQPVQMGVDNAIQASINTGIPLMGIRIDSGDLYIESWEAEAKLENARQYYPSLFANTKIILTDGLSPQKIKGFETKSLEEKNKHFPAKIFGLGTFLVPNPPKGIVTKLCRTEDTEGNIKGSAKVSFDLLSGKTSLPGNLTTLFLYKNGERIADLIVDEDSFDIEEFRKNPQAISYADNQLGILPEFDRVETPLVPVFVEQPIASETDVFVAKCKKISNFVLGRLFGQTPFSSIEGHPKCVYPSIPLNEIRKHAQEQINSLPKSVKNGERLPRYLDPVIYRNLQDIQEQVSFFQKDSHIKKDEVF